MVQKPDGLNQYYFDLFEKTLRANIPEYSKVEKRLISPFGIADAISVVDPTGRFAVSPPKVGEWSDYIYFQGQLATDKADHEVESVVRLLAERLAVSVETLTCDTAAHGEPICYDLFKLSDGSPNLQTFYCVKGSEATLEDPTGSITGWFAYKVRFTVDVKRKDL